MHDHIDAVISLCDKMEGLDLTEAEQTVLRTLVDIARERTDDGDAEVSGFALPAGEPVGLRETIGSLTLTLPDRFERRLAFDRAQPPGSGYQALPELDASGN